MSYVGRVSEEQASSPLNHLYERIRQDYGFLPNYFQALGRSPQAVKAHLSLAGIVLNVGALSRKLKEQIGIAVSGFNTSSYCVAAHMELLRRRGVEKPLSRKLATDYPNAPAGEKEQALFRSADKLTRKPADFSKDEIEALRNAAWDDDATFETILAVAWFNFINRASIGLGVVADF